MEKKTAERFRLQERSGRGRIRAQKHARGTDSINLVHVRAPIRFRTANSVTEALNPHGKRLSWSSASLAAQFRLG
jgi:hypothetical protein